jgi:alpha-1,2-mannosyltransferase
MVGLSRWDSLLLVTVLFLFNNPLIRTLKHDQVNLYVLNAILIGMISLPKSQLLSGFVLSFGGHVKLYPFLFGLPLILMKKWRAVLGIVVGFGIVIFILTDFGRNWEVWKQFIEFLPRLPKPTAFRNNSIHGLLSNLVSFSGLPRRTTYVLTAAATVSVFVWMGVRFLEREKLCGKNSSLSQDGETYRVFGNMVDCSAFMLLLSPSVWEHHYILGLPLAIWVVAQQAGKYPWFVGGAVFLMFVLPTFDVFPLSYHRILGLFICLWLTSPKRIESLRPLSGRLRGSLEPILLR